MFEPEFFSVKPVESRPVTVQSATRLGVDAVPVTVEVDLLQRLPRTVIVGLPGHGVREAADRVRSAVSAAGFEWPRMLVTVNVMPADLRKDATGTDLAIAVGVLVASGQMDADAIKGRLFYGELSLGGILRRVRGSLAVAEAAKRAGLVYVGANDAPGVEEHRTTLYDTVHQLPALVSPADPPSDRVTLDYSDCRGIPAEVYDALVTAARENRPLVLIGSPGCGKTMIAARFGSLLPSMTAEERAECTRIYDAVGLDFGGSARPFRSPHHTVSVAGLVGNAQLLPGEVTLAHNGVLFLDEFPEFPRSSVEILRGPVADKRVSVQTMAQRVDYPANFRLIVSANPCPCGWFGYEGEGTPRCRCSGDAIQRYLSRLDTPILRNAVIVRLPRPDRNALTNGEPGPSSASLRERVTAPE